MSKGNYPSRYASHSGEVGVRAVSKCKAYGNSKSIKTKASGLSKQSVGWRVQVFLSAQITFNPSFI